MSTKQSSEQTLFGQDQNTVITVVSVIIFILSVAMLATFAYQGSSSGWTGYNVVAVAFSSMIAFIFVSIALYFGLVKGKEALLPGVEELKRLYQSEKEKNKVVAEAADKARNEFLMARKEAVAAQTKAKEAVTAEVKK